MHSGTEEPQTGLQAAREAKVAMLRKSIRDGNYRGSPAMLEVVISGLLADMERDDVPSEESRRVEFDRVNVGERWE